MKILARALLCLCALALAFAADAGRLTPSIRSSNVTKTSGAHSISISIPSGTTTAYIGICYYNDTGPESTSRPTSVSLDGQSATFRNGSAHVGGTTMYTALYTVTGFSTGASKTLAYTFSATGVYFTADIAVEFRDGTPTFGANGAGNSESSPGTASTSSLANTSGDEILSTYCTTDGNGTAPNVGTGQTKQDDTLDSTGHAYYGFSTETGSGSGDVQSVSNENIPSIASVVVTTATPPTFSVAPAVGTRTTSSIPITATTTCTDCTFYGVAETDGLGTPTCTQIKAGQGANGSAAYKSFSTAMTASVQATGTFSSYTDGTIRDGGFCMNSTANGDSAVSSIADMYKIPAFTTALTIASATTTVYTTNSKLLDGAGSVYLVGCKIGASAPSVAQVEAQTGGCIIFGNSDDATGTMTLTATSTIYPAYDLYYVGTYGSQHEAAVHALTTQFLSPPSTCGANLDQPCQFVQLSSVAIGGIAAVATLAYDAQSQNFAIGDTVTGGTSGAIGQIIADTDAGATGTLTLWISSGTFQDNEALTGALTGAATVNGTASYLYAANDILVAPTYVMPGGSGMTLTIDVSGNASYTSGSERETALNIAIYDYSAGGYAAGDIDFVNNDSAPACNGGALDVDLELNVAMSAFDLDSHCTDFEGDTLTSIVVGTLPTSTSHNGTTNATTGTPSVQGTYSVRYIVADIYSALGFKDVSFIVSPSWAMPNCVLVLTLATDCADSINTLTGGLVTVISVGVCSTSVAAGYVISQDPVAGENLTSGETEALYYSLGACPDVTVPNCLSKTTTQCQTLLTSAAPFATLSASCSASAKVYTQAPAARSKARYNFTLTAMCR